MLGTCAKGLRWYKKRRNLMKKAAIALLIVLVVLIICSAKPIPEPVQCAICDDLPSDALCIINLKTGKKLDLTIYDPHPYLVGEIADEQIGGWFTLVRGAGIEGYKVGNEYVKVNNIWTKCVDYYGFPTYEEIEEEVKANGMTKEDYNVSITYQTFYSGEMPYSEFLEIMAEKAKEKYDVKNTFGVKLEKTNRSIVQYLVDEQIRPQNTIMLLLFIMVLAAFIWRKDKAALIVLACYLFGRFFAWYYLLFAGRFPLRIPQGLLVTDILVMLGLFLYFGLYGVQEYQKSKVVTLVVYMVGIIVLGFIIKDGNHYLELSQGYVDIYQDRWYGIKEYCMSNPENEYVLTAGSQTLFYFSDNVWETESIGKKQNYYLNSNFDSPSPNYYDRIGVRKEEDMAEAVIEKKDSYWIFEHGTFHEQIPIIKYYKYRYNTFTYEIIDTFDTETTTFEVYRFNK